MTWSRLRRLIDRFPRESRTAQAIGGDAMRWGETEHLLASVIDVSAAHAWISAAVASKTPPPKPKPIPRPGTATRRRPRGRYTPQEIERIRASARPKAEEVTDGN